MTREQANKQILEFLKVYLDTYPDLRFMQALSNLGAFSDLRDVDGTMVVNDPFYIESADTLASLRRNW